ncbi:lamin tail domain-containing protein [Actinacidiphila glaucinigra]|uniref:lamin tail domain-containing protein n=1 Tax=Actinacidiphila glaucinigra TaxID=235986 RepID=UPI002DDB84B0|nr:lamin tail domain-containing protein [Actinacidiphila glaucinigra]WSD58567.1 lamin tail domain-containing protein [Actinacidiphila glaucinigra]
MSARITRRVIATVLASGAIVAGAALPATAADGRDHGRDHGRSSVVIGEVNTRDGHGRFGRGGGEWIEVVNTGRRSVNLRGWTLSDRDGNRYRFNNVWLVGHSKVRVHTGFGRDTRRDVFQDRRNSVWDRRDAATLRNDHRRVVDVKSWSGRR